MINWSSFLLVAAASIGFTLFIVAFFSLGVRLITNARHIMPAAKKGRASAARAEALNRSLAYAFFAICAAALLYGIWLIVPYFHLEG
jgi:cytochrome b561